MNNLVNNASALSLASERLKVFTRYEAYRCKIPPTQKNSNSAFRKFPQMPSLISPCEHKFLPPEETLKSWKKQLQDIIAIASGDYFVETDNGYYSLDSLLKHAGSNYHIITDNFFTSPQLLRSLREKGIAATGTVQLNRVENAPLKPIKEIEKLERESAGFLSMIMPRLLS